jgi:hypothetical protein
MVVGRISIRTASSLPTAVLAGEVGPTVCREDVSYAIGDCPKACRAQLNTIAGTVLTTNQLSSFIRILQFSIPTTSMSRSKTRSNSRPTVRAYPAKLLNSAYRSLKQHQLMAYCIQRDHSIMLAKRNRFYTIPRQSRQSRPCRHKLSSRGIWQVGVTRVFPSSPKLCDRTIWGIIATAVTNVTAFHRIGVCIAAKPISIPRDSFFEQQYGDPDYENYNRGPFLVFRFMNHAKVG